MTDFLSKVIDWDINGNPLCTYEQQIRSMFGDLAVVYVKAAISHTQDQFVERLKALETNNKRYNFIRENSYVELFCDSPRIPDYSFENFDAEVDKAIKRLDLNDHWPK